MPKSYDESLITDPFNAFVPGSAVQVEGASEGPLAGLKFAAKDIYDVAGFVTGGGNPDWARTHDPAETHAPVVQTLLDAGATLVGKTITDELTRGILGSNAHYGTPVNPRAPDRFPGGSSSGSACAVAGGLVDFALGSDTGGSVRIPASFCGLYGLRPTHGRLTLAGVLQQAPSFDTVGWFADDPEIMARVGAVILGSEPIDTQIYRLIVASDAFEVAGEAVAIALAPAINRLKAHAKQTVAMRLCPTSLGEWRRAKQIEQDWEAFQSLSDWIIKTNPRLAYETALRLVRAANLDESDLQNARPVRESHRETMAGLLKSGSMVVLPSAPGPAPHIASCQSDISEARERIRELTCIASGAGLPQISLPLAEMEGCPLGLSLIGPKGADEELLGLARKLGR
ncbi:MAG: amidase [Pseudomonadota bacterium]